MNITPLPWPRKPLARFLLAFTLLYASFHFPWPGFCAAYHDFFIKTGHFAFFDPAGLRAVWFESSADAKLPYNVNICIANRNTFRENGGAGPVRTIHINSRGFGWHPTALIIALFLATPVAWKRRLGGLTLALIVFHVFVYTSLAFMIWKDSTFVGLSNLAEWQLSAGEDIKKMIVMGVGVVVPLLSWLIFALRQPGLLSLPLRPRSASENLYFPPSG